MSSLIRKISLDIIVGMAGLYLALKMSQSQTISFISGIEYSGKLSILFLTGGILGLINFFIEPILKSIFIPLKIITFGLSNLAISMFLVWIVVDIFSPIEIKGIIPLFWTTITIWILKKIFVSSYSRNRK